MPEAEGQRPVRTQLYWDLHDFSHGRGVRASDPLFNPIVSRSEADVRYVDVFDTEQLRTSYTHDPNVDISKIVDVDVRLGRDDGSVATLSEALGPEAPFDWAMASHVVEHVPDLIGWLADVAAVVADGGVLVLAVPDKRYTFDIHRPLTTTGQLLEAHEAQVDRPGTRAVYDHCRASTTVDLVALWNGADPPDYRSRDYTVEQVAELVGKARAGEYIDTHVWVFRPDSFLEHLHELRGLGLVEWSVEELVETEPMQHEFRVRLRRIPRGTDVREALSDELVPALDMPGWQRDFINGPPRARGAGGRARRRARRRRERHLPGCRRRDPAGERRDPDHQAPGAAGEGQEHQGAAASPQRAPAGPGPAAQAAASAVAPEAAPAHPRPRGDAGVDPVAGGRTGPATHPLGAPGLDPRRLTIHP